MNYPTLRAEQVREVIDRAGRGNSLTKRTNDVANRVGSNRMTLISYYKNGAKKGAVNILLCQLAETHGVLTPPAETAN